MPRAVSCLEKPSRNEVAFLQKRIADAFATAKEADEISNHEAVIVSGLFIGVLIFVGIQIFSRLCVPMTGAFL